MFGLAWLVAARQMHIGMCGLCQQQRRCCFLCDVHINHFLRCWRYVNPYAPRIP